MSIRTLEQDIRAEWASTAQTILNHVTDFGTAPTKRDVLAACDLADDFIEQYKKRFRK